VWWNPVFRLDVVAVKGAVDEQVGQKIGVHRADRQRFTSRALSVGLVMPSDLQRIHRIILDAAEVEIISNEMRAVVESLWPGLAHKLPISTASGMALKLLPTGLGPGIDRAPRLDGLHWNGRSAHLRPMTRSDRMATLEEAKAQLFQKSWGTRGRRG
jgi:hypothetical protein